MTTRTLISNFKTSGISMMKSTSLEKLQTLIDDCNAAYYNHQSAQLLTDNEFDVLKEYVDRVGAGAAGAGGAGAGAAGATGRDEWCWKRGGKDSNEIVWSGGVLTNKNGPGTSPFIREGGVGAPIDTSSAHEKVKLPYLMASMDKIKPDTKALGMWKQKYGKAHQKIVSVKLDGVSGLFSTEGGVAKLYTRGNGRIGQDISHIISHIPALMNMVKLSSNGDYEITVRGEFIIAKDAFDILRESADEGERMSNPRNFVSGVINSKHSKYYGNIDFVVYELIRYRLHSWTHFLTDVVEPKPSDQFDVIEQHNIPVVDWIAVPNSELTNNMLSERLVRMRKEYKYEIDGLIVADDAKHERFCDEVKNPEHAFAFKMVLSEQIAETKVVAVLWSASKDGYLKPKIQMEPISIGGSTIEFATAFNAGFVVDNKIGVGAVVKIIRSGDVIPTIMEVMAPASVVMLPQDLEWKWGPTKVDIILKNPDENERVKLKRIAHFFSGIGVAGLGEGILKRIMAEGFDTIPVIIKMDLDDFMDIDGFQETLSKKILKNINYSLRDTTVAKIMSVSNIFGRGMGEKKLELLLAEYPEVLIDINGDEYMVDKVERIASIKGFSYNSAEQLAECIDQFIDFTKECGLYKKKVMNFIKRTHKAPDTSHVLYGKTVVLTGFRDKVFETTLKGAGAKLGSSVSSNVFALVVKDSDAAASGNSTKIVKAREIGIDIVDVVRFSKKYL